VIPFRCATGFKRSTACQHLRVEIRLKEAVALAVVALCEAGLGPEAAGENPLGHGGVGETVTLSSAQ